MITADQLQRCNVLAMTAAVYASPLSIACERFDINTPTRIAAFLAQCWVESDGLRNTEEVLYYTHADRLCDVYPSHFHTPADAEPYLRNPAKLASCVYAYKNGNGSEASGDGFKYRGRGLFQLTGALNYANAEIALMHSYIEEPDLVSLPPDACLTAAWYWHNIRGNVLADAGQIDTITRLINGSAMLKADVRRHRAADFLAILS